MQGSGCGDVPPGPPTNLKAEAGNRQVKLTWDKPSNGEFVQNLFSDTYVIWSLCSWIFLAYY